MRTRQTLIFGQDVAKSKDARRVREPCRVNMTVLLSFEETDNARACALSGHCPFKYGGPRSAISNSLWIAINLIPIIKAFYRIYLSGFVSL